MPDIVTAFFLSLCPLTGGLIGSLTFSKLHGVGLNYWAAYIGNLGRIGCGTRTYSPFPPAPPKNNIRKIQFHFYLFSVPELLWVTETLIVSTSILLPSLNPQPPQKGRVVRSSKDGVTSYPRTFLILALESQVLRNYRS